MADSNYTFSDDYYGNEASELSNKIQYYFDTGINFFDKLTAFVTYAALMFSTVIEYADYKLPEY